MNVPEKCKLLCEMGIEEIYEMLHTFANDDDTIYMLVCKACDAIQNVDCCDDNGEYMDTTNRMALIYATQIIEFFSTAVEFDQDMLWLLLSRRLYYTLYVVIRNNTHARNLFSTMGDVFHQYLRNPVLDHMSTWVEIVILYVVCGNVDHIMIAVESIPEIINYLYETRFESSDIFLHRGLWLLVHLVNSNFYRQQSCHEFSKLTCILNRSLVNKDGMSAMVSTLLVQIMCAYVSVSTIDICAVRRLFLKAAGLLCRIEKYPFYQQTLMHSLVMLCAIYDRVLDEIPEHVIQLLISELHSGVGRNTGDANYITSSNNLYHTIIMRTQMMTV